MALRPDTIDEMTSLFSDCHPERLKRALQNAMLGSGDFFPGPGRIMQEYRKNEDEGMGQEQTKEWFDHADGINSSLVITTTKKDAKGVEVKEKLTYSDITRAGQWAIRKKNYENGYWYTIDESIPSRKLTSYTKWQEGDRSDIYKEGGYHHFGAVSLPYLLVLPR